MRKTIRNLAVVLLAPLLLAAQSDTKVLEIKPGKNNPRNSEGDFVTLKDGSILFVYTHFTGESASDFGGSHLASRISRDQGKTWSGEDRIVVENEGKMNVMSVSLVRLKSGKIALFYLRKNAINDCLPLMRLSSDEGKSWGEPIVCIRDEPGYYVLNNSRVVQLPGGRLLMPVALHTSKSRPGATLEELEKSFNNHGKIYSYYSDDEGRNWKRSSEVAIPTEVIAQEPGLVTLGDGRILMFIRTDSGRQYTAYSSDKGVTWTRGEKSVIVSPLSPASIAVIPGRKDLLLVWNNNDETGPGRKGKRTPLTVAVSRDNGMTWDKTRNIETDPDGSYCYTGIHFAGNSVLLNYFDWRTRQVTIRKIPLSRIYE